MNIIKKLTLAHLKENKGRTIITTLGICVSVAMITAVLVSVASFMKFYGEVCIFEYGNNHITYYEINGEPSDVDRLEALKADENVDKVGIYIDMPEESDSFRISENTSSIGFNSIYAGDEENLRQMITADYEGVIPTDENEIMLESSFISDNKLDWKIGDTITVELGERYDDLENHITSSSHWSNESFAPSGETAQFTIVGIMHNNYPTKSYGCVLRGLSKAEKEGIVNATVLLKNPNYKSLDVIEQLSEKIGIKKNSGMMDINTDYFESVFAIDENSVIMKSIFPMALIVLVIIMVASVILIYNSFGMSLSERTRYLGMLGSVGATKKQKKQSVYYEGLLLGVVGIPVGTIAGIIGIAVTLAIVGDKIASTSMLNFGSDNISFDTVVPLWAIAGIVIFSAITILISSIIPAKRASAITPVDALRQSTEFKLKAKSFKTPKIIRKIFGYEGELAHKNLKRNGRKSRVISVSIAMSVILFISVTYFCDMFMRANVDASLPYQLEVNVSLDDRDTLLKTIKNTENVKDAYCIEKSSAYLYKFDEDVIIVENPLYVEDSFTNTYKDIVNDDRYMLVIALEDERFNSLCTENSIDYNDYYDLKDSSSIKILLLNNFSRNERGDAVFNDSAIGRNIPFWTNEEINIPLQVHDLIDYSEDNDILKLVAKGYLAGYMPESAYVGYEDMIFGECSHYTNIAVKTTEHEKVANAIYDYITLNSLASVSVYDIEESTESMNTLVFVLRVFVYGFITLITMITIANIVNTISTSIALRRKEFAMLKSVGATQKGFYKMVCLESLFYGLRALIFAVPISVLLCYIMNNMLESREVPFELDIMLYVYVIVAVFIIIGFSMIYSVSKIKKDSIIETLKHDIT